MISLLILRFLNIWKSRCNECILLLCKNMVEKWISSNFSWDSKQLNKVDDNTQDCKYWVYSYFLGKPTHYFFITINEQPPSIQNVANSNEWMKREVNKTAWNNVYQFGWLYNIQWNSVEYFWDKNKFQHYMYPWLP